MCLCWAKRNETNKCALYLGKTNFKYQFTGLTILGCLAAIYILYMYLKRINKKICEYMLWNLWLYISDNRSWESGVGPEKVPGVGVGVVVFRMQGVGVGTGVGFFWSDSSTLIDIFGKCKFEWEE